MAQKKPSSVNAITSPIQQAGPAAPPLAEALDAELARSAWQMMMSASRIALLAHEHPDGDALGSALGLAFVLRGFGKTCAPVCIDPAPAVYRFLPGVEDLQQDLGDESFDLVIALDAGDLTRYGALYERHRAFLDGAAIVNLDHHLTSAGCGQVNIIDVASAATAELITLLLIQVGAAISRDAAVCLMTGIVTDTRAFEYSATTPRTLEVAAHLMRAGAVPAEIVKPVYRVNPLAKARLWGLAQSAIESAVDGRLVWSMLTQEMLNAARASTGMDDSLPSYLIDIEGAEIAALFKEHADGYPRVSLRTVHPYNAALMAAHFGGGGHERAAGLTFRGTLEQAKTEVLAYLEAQLRAVK